MPSSKDTYYVINELLGRTNDIVRRIRDLEQRYKDFVFRINSLENSLIDFRKEIIQREKETDENFSQLNEKILGLEKKFSDLVTQMKRFASKSEVLGLKELLDIYNPVKSKFVTREQVEDMIKRK